MKALIILGSLVIAALLAPVADGRHLISQKNRRFDPGQITIRPGDVVVFQNDDLTEHHIFARKGPSKFESRLLARGASYEVTFEEAGKWRVGCRIHPRMRLDVTARAEPE